MLRIKWTPREEKLPDKRSEDQSGCLLAWHKYQGLMVTGSKRVRDCEFFTHWAPAIAGPYDVGPERNACGVRAYDYRRGIYIEPKDWRREKILERALKWGLPSSEGHIDMAIRMADEYGIEFLMAAMDRAGTGRDMNWGYVEGILKDWRRKGGMDERGSGRRQNYGRQVGAQQYEQRQYTEDELLAVSDDLIAEAREARNA